MGRAELIAEIEKRKKQNEIVKQIKKRGFLNKYFDYEKIIKNKKNIEIIESLKVSEEEFNEVYLKTFNNKKRINIFYGGSGSGKSEYIARRYALKFLLEDGHNGLFLRKVDKDVKRSIYPLLRKILNEFLGKDRDKFVTINKTDKTFTFHNGNQIICAGLDDEERLKSITFEHGVLTNVWMEEANQMIGNEIKEIRRRLRGISKAKKEIVISFNPVSKSSWLYKMFFNLELEVKKYHVGKNILIMKTTIHDNKYATESDIRELEDQEDVYDKEVYLYGNFGVLSDNDSIIPYSDCMHCTDYLDLDEEGPLYIGLDCAGMGNDKTVAKVRKGAIELPYGFKLGQVEESETVDSLIMLIQDLQDEYTEINLKTKEEFIPEVIVNIDATGVGFGVASQMRTAKSKGKINNVIINEILFGNPAKDKDRYFNLVTEMYFNIRNLVKKREIHLLKDDETINEICSRKFTIDEKSSRRRIEDKKSFKKRLGSSPDNGDAFVMTFYVPKQIHGVINLNEYKEEDEFEEYDDDLEDFGMSGGE